MTEAGAMKLAVNDGEAQRTMAKQILPGFMIC